MYLEDEEVYYEVQRGICGVSTTTRRPYVDNSAALSGVSSSFGFLAFAPVANAISHVIHEGCHGTQATHLE